LAAFEAAVKLNLELNLVAVIPLTENLLNGHSTKPGDVVTAMNGKTIEIDNTDAEGRLILADAITYVCRNYKLKSVVELSTLTGAMDVALGYPFAGVFTNNDVLWDQLEKAGKAVSDPFWRMPLSEEYKHQIKSQVADLKNVGGRSAGSCTAAIFLQEFLCSPDSKDKDSSTTIKKTIPFAHIDIAGVFHKRSGPDFLSSGMTGRPTRAIVEYLANASHK
jgi:aminopeptidase